MKVLLVMADFFEPQYHGLWEEAQRQGVDFDVVIAKSHDQPRPSASFGPVTALESLRLRPRLIPISRSHTAHRARN